MGSLVRRSSILVQRTVKTQVWKKCSHEAPSQKDFLSKSVGGDPFYQMPFSFRNAGAFTVKFLLFFGIPFWAPPIVIHLQLWKRSYT